MKKYLLDTSICVFLFRNKYNVAKRLDEVGIDNCFISDVTLAELTYGAYKSERVEENLKLIAELAEDIGIVSFNESIDVYAKEKNRLRENGTPIEDFDLLIASAAISRGYTLITDNVKHFDRVHGLLYENWIER